MWKKRHTRSGWLMRTLLLAVGLSTFMILFKFLGPNVTWTSTSVNSSTTRLDDRSSTITVVLASSKRNTSESLLWLPRQESVDIRRFPPLTRPMYFQISKDGITAVLPITESSLLDFDSNIDSILSAHPSRLFIFYEIIVTCHPRIAAKTELAVDKTRGSLPVAIPVTVLPWSQSDNSSVGMLHVLHSVLTSRVLLLDITAFRYIEEPMRLILLDSLTINFPVGPHGILITPYNTTCVETLTYPVPAAYLIPPILAPTVLLINAENGMRLTENRWAALGDRIVKTTGAGFGGLVLKSSGRSYRWCTSSLMSLDLVSSSTFLKLFYELLKNGADHRSFSSPRLSLMLPGRNELKSFSPAICEMAHRGYSLRILLFSWTKVELSSHFALDMGCHLHFEVIAHDTSTPFLIQRLEAWTLAANFDVLIYTSERSVHSMRVEASVEYFRLSRGTVVRIPIADLPFCEWMAMLSLSDWQHWHTPRIDLSVITNDRPQSLTRLLNSLNSARYYGDTVHLKINLDQTADTKTHQTVAQFRWTFGTLIVQHRVISAGLLPAVVEAWYPHGNDSYGVLLEDDVEVSPLFYAWIKMAILRYRYGQPWQDARSMFGISLYQPQNLELRIEGRVPFDPRILFSGSNIADLRTPYLSQVPCSWGAVYFPEHFQEFHDYLALRLSQVTHNITEVIVPEVRSNRWTRSWKKYFNELVYLRGYVMLYPNYDLSLATNHAEIGAHVKSKLQDVPEAIRRQYDVPLMPLPSLPGETRSASLLELPGESLPAWDDLPVLDLWGVITSHQEIIRRGHDRHGLVSGCFSRLVQFTYDAHELLCSRTIFVT